MTLKLYGRRLSPFYERIHLQIALKNLSDEIEFAPLPGDDLKSPEYMAISPLGKIPALEDDGFCLPESAVIAEYIEDRFPKDALLPDDLAKRAQARLVCRFVDLNVIPHLFDLIGQVRGGDPDADKVETIKSDLEKGLNAIEGMAYGDGNNVEGGNARLIGDGVTLADCALLPALFFATRFLPSIDMDPFAGRPKLKAWYEAMLNTDLGKDSDTQMQKELEAFLAAQDAA